jgi:hypothetical protein
MRGMVKKRAERYFLKDIVGILELKKADAVIPEREAQLLLYILEVSSLTCLLTILIIRLSCGYPFLWVCPSMAEAAEDFMD